MGWVKDKGSISQFKEGGKVKYKKGGKIGGKDDLPSNVDFDEFESWNVTGTPRKDPQRGTPGVPLYDIKSKKKKVKFKEGGKVSVYDKLERKRIASKIKRQKIGEKEVTQKPRERTPEPNPAHYLKEPIPVEDLPYALTSNQIKLKKCMKKEIKRQG